MEHAKLGAAVALSFLLTAVPSLPQQLWAGLEVITVRGVAVLCGASVVMLTDGLPTVRAIAVVAAALFGAMVDRIGPTAGLAVILPTIHVPAVVTPQGVLFALWPYAAGTLAIAVAVAWLGWAGRSAVESTRPMRVRHRRESTCPTVPMVTPCGSA